MHNLYVKKYEANEERPIVSYHYYMKYFKKILTCHLDIQERTHVALVISFKFTSIQLLMQ